MTEATPPRAASAKPIVNKRWLWVVRVLALLTLLLSLAGVLRSTSEERRATAADPPLPGS